MAKITIICVGKAKKDYIKKGSDEYIKRIKNYADIEILDFEAQPLLAEDDKNAIDTALEKEAVAIEKRIKEGSVVVALDVRGKELSSEEFADKMNDWFISGKSNITFIIGGSYGLHSRILERADFRFSMSPLTFPHQLARLIILEQIFRCFKIIRGEKYHK